MAAGTQDPPMEEKRMAKGMNKEMTIGIGMVCLCLAVAILVPEVEQRSHRGGEAVEQEETGAREDRVQPFDILPSVQMAEGEEHADHEVLR